MSAMIPLLGGRDLRSTVAWQGGRPVSAAQFLADAATLAEQFPASGQAVNLCLDRYAFALGMVAALLRGQVSLMPPNTLQQTLRQLPSGDAPPYVLADDPAVDAAGLPRVSVSALPGALAAADEPLVAADQVAVCLLTSGSTGPPQPHYKRWGALQSNIGAESARLAELMALPSIDGLNIVATVPAQHSYGFESSVLLSLLGGAAFDSGRPFYPADIASALGRLPRPRALVTTPLHLKTLLLSGVALPPTDLLLSATAPLSPQLAAQAEAATGGRLVEIYGCTEAGQVAARRTTAGDVWTTLGALRLRCETMPDGPCFVVQGGHVLEPTPLADTLELLDEHRFRLLGRTNDLIHVAGKRSSLAHLNFHLNRIDGVRDGTFWLAGDDGESSARTVVFVVAPGLDSGRLLAALRDSIEPAFLPRRIVHVDALPREGTGKLTAQALQRFATETLARGAPR